MNVLSLFDGMSCGQQALERAGIKVDKYFASEIDKYAIKVTMANYPNTIQLGSVVDVDGYSLPKIDLLIGGSPCQSFSFAGKRKGMSTKDEQEILTLDHYLKLKADQYEFEGQSYLFWEYMRLLNEVKPTYFLLENVLMGEKWEKVLTKAIGVKPIEINSALVSGQNRRRLYWTNIGMKPMGLFGDLESTIQQPKDKGILLKDILESEVDEKYFLSENVVSRFKKYNTNSNIIGTTAPDFRTIGQRDEVYGINGKMGCLNATDYKQPKQLMIYNNTRLNKTIEKNIEEFNDKPLFIDSYNQAVHEDKSICISTRVNASNNNHIYIPEATKKGFVEIKPGDCFDAENLNSETRRGRLMEEKSNCLMAKKTDFMYYEPSNEGLKSIQLGMSKEWGNCESDKGKSYTLCKAGVHGVKYKTGRIRRLTPIECERLQTVPEGYTEGVSNTQRYKMLGNGWTVDVIKHILRNIEL